MRILAASLALLTLIVITPSTKAQNASQTAAYTLQYQNDNRWVAVADNAPLRALISAAKKKQSDIKLTFTLPAGQDNLNRERVLILRDILRNNTQKNIHLHQETEADSATHNTITLQFSS